MTPSVEKVALRRKLQSTFCVSVRPWTHSGIHKCVPSFWTRRTLGYWVWEPSGTLLKEQGSYNLVQDMGHKGPALRPRCIESGRARTQILFIVLYCILSCSILSYPILSYPILFYSILFYSILSYSILPYPILFYSILSYPILFYSILLYSSQRTGSLQSPTM
jgi:hypothetical protein